eukprot:COSAG02_NODE_57288_length_281_cov_0.719780_1_plen_81_part_01
MLWGRDWGGCPANTEPTWSEAHEAHVESVRSVSVAPEGSPLWWHTLTHPSCPAAVWGANTDVQGSHFYMGSCRRRAAAARA